MLHARQNLGGPHHHGDTITGYITQNRGISIHRQDGFNIQQALKHRPQRITAFQWEDFSSKHTPVSITIVAYDSPSLIATVSSTLSHENIPILG